MSYYDLSAGESGEEDDYESSEGEDSNDSFNTTTTDHRKRTAHDDHSPSCWNSSNGNDNETAKNTTWSHCILHLDVDCFYCACEQVDRPQDQLHLRPFAIGQKHIIVTCNYVARGYGVRKLCSRQEALLKCPSLLILEGSDLERYRQHSYRIYQCFRSCLQELCCAKQLAPTAVAARKGGMDEMFADVTQLVDAMQTNEPTTSNADRNCLPDKQLFVYGDNDYSQSSEPTILTEDQTGATVTIRHPSHAYHNDDNGNGHFYRDDDSISPASRYHHRQQQQKQQQHVCQSHLHIAARRIAQLVQQRIQDQLGFTTTVGISVSPLLAKLASSTHKPHSLNLLYPWRAAHLTMNMPLRKLPQLGHATYHALHSCLLYEYQQRQRQYGVAMTVASSTPPPFWTCRDLSQVPHDQIVKCLEKVKSLKKTSHDYCTRLLQQCRGIDTTTIVDDDGGLTKTVSVENSFRRGTVCRPPLVHQALAELCVRLPKLLRERQHQSPQPLNAFPSTIRLTARNIVIHSNQQQQEDSDDDDDIDDNADDEEEQLSPYTQPASSKWEASQYQNQRRRRLHVTKSKQAPFDGQRFMSQHDNPEVQQQFLKRAVAPLLQELVFGNTATKAPLNITRLNLAVTNFADVKSANTPAVALFPSPFASAQSAKCLLQNGPLKHATSTVAFDNLWTSTSAKHRDRKTSSDNVVVANRKAAAVFFMSSPSNSSSNPSAWKRQTVSRQLSSNSGLCNKRNLEPCDSTCLSIESEGRHLPRNIAEDVATTHNAASKRRRRIDHFFSPKGLSK